MLIPGSMLQNRYEIIERIGSGGMADVYKAKDKRLNRFVAIKVLKHEFSSDDDFVRKFRAEAQSAAGLSHPNIVGVYDVGDENGIYFIIMELIEGITLKNYIEMKGKLSIREALNISVQIASGLSAAHEKRIIHRDIKPQNIIISRDGKVKISDFGIAKMADSKTVTTTAAGTVHYISPEQARGGYSDERSDIYSLGITMYEMVTGRVPFDGETNVAIALLHIQGEMTPPSEINPEVPKSLEKIILKCTQKKPERRYSSAKELIADLRQVLTHPDGAYVTLGSAVPEGDTVVIGDALSSIKNKAADSAAAANDSGSSRKAAMEETLPSMDEEEEEEQTRVVPKKRDNYVQDTENERYVDEYDGDDDESSSGKGAKIAIIVGVIILAAVIAFFALRSSNLLGGLNNAETETEDIETVAVPDLTGMTVEEAKSALSDAKLGIKAVEQTPDNDDGSYTEGEIYDQDPEANTQTQIHTTVTVYVYTPETFELPDVSDMDYEKAQTQLESRGLTVQIEYKKDSSVEEDHVIETSPSAGSKVSKGDTVTLYVSEGEETESEETEVTVPNVCGEDLDDAIVELQNAGLYYGGSSEEYSTSYSEGQVMAQSVTAGTKVDKGTSVTLTVSKGEESTTYSATVSVVSPFNQTYVDSSGNVQTVTEGEVRIVVVQSGMSTRTVYDQQTDSSSLPATIDVQSTQSGSATVNMYLNGTLYDTSTINFQ